MFKHLPIFFLMSGVLFSQNRSQEFLSGRLVKSIDDDQMFVSTSFRSNQDKLFTFDVYISNKSDSKTYRIKDFKASIESKKGKKELTVMSRNEFLAKQEKKDKRKATLKKIGGRIRAYNAGLNTSETNTTKSGYSNTSFRGKVNSNSEVSDNYGNNLGNVNTQSNFRGNATSYSTENTNSYTESTNGEARYAAQQLEDQKLEEFKAQSISQRSKWSSEYLKNNTIHKGETKNGLIKIKSSKGESILLSIVIEDLIYDFEWDPSDAANLD